MRAQDFLDGALKDLKFRMSFPGEVVTTQEYIDNFAIDFAEWLDNKYYQGENYNEYHRSINEYREGKYFTAKQLLERYKKEKQL
jgi:hypothetical protein